MGVPLLPPRVHRWIHGELAVWYHPDYRLPVPALEHLGRRAQLVADWMLDVGLVGQLHAPERPGLEVLTTVHSAEWIDALTRPEALSAVFGMPVPVDPVLDTIRYAVGGTLAAAAEARRTHRPTLNLLGGFHHAHPSRGHGFSALNDIAIAARAEGVSVGVLDLDAHPPDGTAACLPEAWIGSISGVTWDALDRVDDTVLPGADDATYLRALDALLGRLPTRDLWFVVAGGDVLAGDALGRLSLTLAGVKERDARVYAALHDKASVWLPGGGYSEDAWRVLAGTAAVLAGQPGLELRPDQDPLRARFARIYGDTSDTELSAADVDASLRLRDGLLGWYSASAIELALERYGLLRELRRLGYDQLQVRVDSNEAGDRMRVLSGKDLLVEGVVARSQVGGRPVLWVHWLTLRHPRGTFTPHRPRLPGQDAPGLGLAREATELLALVAKRVGCEGVAMRPSELHVAWIMYGNMQFADRDVAARFLAIRRDLGQVPLADLTRACASGRLLRNGEPFTWEPATMVGWLDGHHDAVEPAPDRFSIG